VDAPGSEEVPLSETETIVVDQTIAYKNFPSWYPLPTAHERFLTRSALLKHLSDAFGPAIRVSKDSAARPGYHGVVARPSLTTHGVEFLRHVAPRIIRPLRSLWHEVIGFLFLVLATMFGSAAVRSYLKLGEQDGAMVRLVGAGFLTLLMAWFGITSFLRARKISRS
jgi:hypothetical protein